MVARTQTREPRHWALGEPGGVRGRRHTSFRWHGRLFAGYLQHCVDSYRIWLGVRPEVRSRVPHLPGLVETALPGHTGQLLAIYPWSAPQYSGLFMRSMVA